jgi:processing peptidase subunit alpha
MLEAVSQDDVMRFVHKLLSSKPSLALFGDGTSSVNPAVLARRYG